MTDDEVRAAFRAYDGPNGHAARNQTAWQIWRDAVAWSLSQGKQQAEGLTAWQISERMPNHHRQRTSLENINDVLEVLAALFAENKGDAS